MIERLGHEPVMSDYSDVLYDPRSHTHVNCVNDIPTADVIILLIGPRFGGQVIPDVLSYIDLEKVFSQSTATAGKSEVPERISITQAEILKAIEADIHVFAFVDARVYSDHHVYQSNKGRDFSEEIVYPSIDKPETAKFIFEFINFLTHRVKNNALIPFSNFSEIEAHLVRQWSMLFSQLLREERDKKSESRRAEGVFEQIQDLKAVMLQSFSAPNAKEIARGVIRFRRLIDIIGPLGQASEQYSLINATGTLVDHLLKIGIKEIMVFDRPTMYQTIFTLEDGTYFACRIGFRLERYNDEWTAWTMLSKDAKSAIYNAVIEAESALPMVRRRNEPAVKYIDENGGPSAIGTFIPLRLMHGEKDKRPSDDPPPRVRRRRRSQDAG